VACSLFSLNVQRALEWGNLQHTQLTAVQQDLQAGRPFCKVMASHSRTLLPAGGNPAVLGQLFGMMRRAGIQPFAAMGEDLPFREVSLSAEPIGSGNVACKDGVYQGTTADAWVEFALPKPQLVSGIRFKIRYAPGSLANNSSARLRMFWRKAGENRFPQVESYVEALFWKPGPTLEEKTVQVWIDETIDRFRLYPDLHPCGFKVTEVALLIPVDSPGLPLPAGAARNAGD
jgi:hypothetical protein